MAPYYIEVTEGEQGGMIWKEWRAEGETMRRWMLVVVVAFVMVGVALVTAA